MNWIISMMQKKLLGNDRKTFQNVESKPGKNSWQFVLTVLAQNGQDIKFNGGICYLDYIIHKRQDYVRKPLRVTTHPINFDVGPK